LAKRSIEDYRPRGLDLEAQYVSGDLVNRLVKIAGSLPDRMFRVTRYNELAEPIDVEVSARHHLAHELEIAAKAYRLRSDDSRKPTTAQLAGALDDIERAATELLHLLRVAGEAGSSIDNMPSALRYGPLHDEAAAEAARLDKEWGSEPRSADSLMREAIVGLDRLRRWSRSAKNKEADQQSGAPRKANEGDPALNAFLKIVAFRCWEETCGQKLRIGPRLVRFVHLSAEAIGRELGDDDALTKRLQRVLCG
jgi:hypothetical protein